MISWRDLLSPAQPRLLPAHRWFKIGLRSVHLVGVAGLGAGYLYTGDDATWRVYLYITLFSGVLLTALEIWSNPAWLAQVRGQAIMLKLLLLGLTVDFPDWRATLLIMVVLISGITAHAPAALRHYSLIHRRRIDRL